MQRLLGAITWVRPLLGITNRGLQPLFDLLKGDSAPNSPRYLTEEARHSLNKVSSPIQTHQAHQMDPVLPFLLVVLGRGPQLHALIFQWDSKLSDP